MITNQKYIVLWLLFALCLGLTACGGDDGLVSADKSSLVTDTAEIDSNYEYELPVIFHVLYKDQSDASQYIPAARLKNLLQYVNEIYQGASMVRARTSICSSSWLRRTRMARDSERLESNT